MFSVYSLENKIIYFFLKWIKNLEKSRNSMSEYKMHKDKLICCSFWMVVITRNKTQKLNI